jgi:2,3-diketo-5-methylthiopentyl-1-phosphate enolase
MFITEFKVNKMRKLWEKADTIRGLLAQPDGIDIDEHFIATYYVETTSPQPVEYAEGMAVEQTTGTWTPVPEETPEVREKHAGKVVALVKIPRAPTSWVVQIAFPMENIDPNMNLFNSTLMGNISWWGIGMRDYALKLTDLQIPKEWMKQFKGPKFGVPGIRKLLNIPKRNILNNMIKPCTGIPTSVIAKLFEGAAMGGVDIIKDDELIADPPFAPFFDRLAKCMEIVDKKRSETGEYTLYTINVTDRTDKLLEKAEKAVQAGANALMLDSGAGLEALRMLAEDPSIKVPILYHNCYAGTQVASEFGGMTAHVHQKLVRLCGGDISLQPDYMGKFPTDRTQCLLSVNTCLLPLQHLKPVLCLIGGGVHPGLVPHIIEEYGLDVLIGAGGAVHGHPMGPIAGGKALRQAIDACVEGIPLTEYAETHGELKAALEKWGYPASELEAKKIFDLAGGQRA